jgi:hypothetical protein
MNPMLTVITVVYNNAQDIERTHCFRCLINRTLKLSMWLLMAHLQMVP